ncbi:MAG: SDR family oxidoreductase [Thermoleophilaceae bacterium]
MRVVVAGGHGQIAQRLLRMLAEGGHEAAGLVRNPEHIADLQALGAEGILADLEADDDTAAGVEGADAVVFAAGAGPGSGAERKRTMDLGGALKLIDAAKAGGVRRYLMVSAMGTSDPAAGGPMQPYLEAKAEADAALRDSGLGWTVLKPGRLTNDAGSGRVALAQRLGRRGKVPRDDVAAVLLACLEHAGTIGRDLELLAGETPVDEAVRSL